MKMAAKILAVALVSSVMASSALAQGFFVDIDLGKASYSNSPSNNGASFPSSTAIGIGGGYHFNQYMGVEAGYSTIEKSTLNSSYGFGATSTETMKTSALYVAAVGTYSFDDHFDVFGKLGLANTKVTYDFASNFGTTGSGSASKTNLMFGLGGQFNFNHHFGIRAQYENFGKTKVTPTYNGVSGNTSNTGVKVFSVGGVFNF